MKRLVQGKAYLKRFVKVFVSQCYYIEIFLLEIFTLTYSLSFVHSIKLCYYIDCQYFINEIIENISKKDQYY